MNLKKYTYLTLLLTASIPAMAYAQDRSAFARDRNISVGERLLPEYSPIGIKSGGFTYYPRIPVSAEFNDNIFYTNTNKTNDTILTIAPELGIKSNWSRHALGLIARVGYDKYIDNDNESAGFYNLAGNARIDTYGFSNLFGGFELQGGSEPRGEELYLSSAAERVQFSYGGVNFGYKYEYNRLRATVGYKYNTYNYDDVKSVNGGTIDQDYRDRSEQSVEFKGEYAYSPSVAFFVSAAPVKIKYDNSNINRDSDGYDVNVGSNFDISELSRGEIKLGGFSRNYDNPLFKKASGFSLDSKFEYFPTRLTTITLTGNSGLRESAELNSSGYKYTSFGIRLDHELMRNVLLYGNIGTSSSDYSDIDRTDDRFNVGVGAVYKLNQNISIVSSYNNLTLNSSGINAVREYKDNSFKVGISYAF